MFSSRVALRYAAGPVAGGEESTRAIAAAFLANMGIAAAKFVGFVLTGSSSMLAEGAHSVADTVNELFLLTALSRSRKPADVQHPFGYGMERYFWSLLAAVGIFVLGAGFSIYEGVHTLQHPEPLESPLVAYAVLAASFLFEGTSWAKAVVQLRREAADRNVGVLTHTLQTPDPTVKTVAFEDTAALIGILLAAAGITMHLLTGSGAWDGVASILIGVLLIGVAASLGSSSKSNLIGEAVSEDVREGLTRVINESVGVDVVVELLTMRLGPTDVLVAARVDVDDAATGGRPGEDRRRRGGPAAGELPRGAARVPRPHLRLARGGGRRGRRLTGRLSRRARRPRRPPGSARGAATRTARACGGSARRPRRPTSRTAPR